MFGVGIYALFIAPWPTGRWVVLIAPFLAFELAGLLLHRWWRGSWIPPLPIRRDALVLPVGIGGVLVFWFTPGGLVAKLAASSAYAAVVLALVAAWVVPRRGWRGRIRSWDDSSR